MSTHTDKNQENKNKVFADGFPRKRSGGASIQFIDNRPEAIAERKLQAVIDNAPQVQRMTQVREMANTRPQMQGTVQLQAIDVSGSAPQSMIKKENTPEENLSPHVEHLSGSLEDDVKMYCKLDQSAPLQIPADQEGGNNALAHIPVLQRLVSQIILSEATNSKMEIDEEEQGLIIEKEEKQGLIIKELLIIGRPQMVYTSTMGDHSTAFTVHKESLIQKIKGKSIFAGFKIIESMYNQAQRLPGMAYLKNLPERSELDESGKKTQKERLEQSQKNLNALLEEHIKHIKKDLPSYSMLHLQDCICEYLEFRELIPLSTINVRAKAPVLAGKGKGEDVGPLLNQNSSAEEKLKTAVGLFDMNSVALVVVEQKEEILKQMMPGLEAEVAIPDRLNVFIDQHVQSIVMAFPESFKGDFSKETLSECLRREMTPIVGEWLVATRDDLRRDISRLQNELKKNQDDLPHESKKRKEKIAARNIEVVREISEIEKAIDGVQNVYKAYIKHQMPEYGVDDHKGKKVEFRKSKSIKKAKIEKIEKIENKDVEEQMDLENSNNKQDPESKKEILEKKVKSSLASQIKLDQEGKLKTIQSGGRSPSPFSGTMGAHTTAWIVHVDRIRAALLGQSVENAVKTMNDTLVPEALKLCKQRNECKDLKMDYYQKDLLPKSKKILESFPLKFKENPFVIWVSFLQEYINALLTFINFIPGSTMYVADTGGKSEGSHRKTLRNFESGGEASQGTLQDAIKGLLDLKAVPENAKGLIECDHKKIIELTYPKSYAAVYKGEPSNILKLLPKTSFNKKRKKRSSWGEDEYIG